MTPITRFVTVGLLVAYVVFYISFSSKGISNNGHAGVHAPPRSPQIYPALCSGMSIVQVTIASHVSSVPTLHRRLTPSSPPRQIASN